MDFLSYVTLTEESVIDYVKQMVMFFPSDAVLSSKEIGDGNLNYVYRVMETESGRSLIVKQSGEFARATPDYKLTTDRSRIEAEILSRQAKLSPGSVPEVYLYDEVMCCCVMEDLIDYKILRGELINYNTFPNFAEQMADFLANTLIRTSDLVMNSSEKKEWVKHFINPELCLISEDLVFVDPYTNAGETNDVFEDNKSFVESKIYDDQALKFEAAKLYVKFKANAQSLIHGDLHSGSIFVNKNSTKVFDPEFAFFGPAGYDVGNVIGNLIFAWAGALQTMPCGMEKEDFLGWIQDTIGIMVDRFAEKSIHIIMNESKDPLCNTKQFAQWYVERILEDSAGYAGLEMIRRIVGEAHVKDIAGIQDSKKRLRAEQLVLSIGKKLILNRKTFHYGNDFSALLQ